MCFFVSTHTPDAPPPPLPPPPAFLLPVRSYPMRNIKIVVGIILQGAVVVTAIAAVVVI